MQRRQMEALEAVRRVQSSLDAGSRSRRSKEREVTRVDLELELDLKSAAFAVVRIEIACDGTSGRRQQSASAVASA
jgi:hypothetical protein